MNTKYKIIGGYYVKNPNNKEELLDVLINVMSSKGMVVDYLYLKSLTKEQLKEKLETIDKKYNCVVFEYDLNHNCRINMGIHNSKNKSVEFAGNKIYIQSFEEYIQSVEDRLAEGNTLTEQEKNLYTKLKSNLEHKN